MRETIELTLDGREYRSTLYSGSKGLTLLQRLLSILGKPLMAMMMNGLDANINKDMMSEAFDALLDKMSEDANLFVVLSKDVLQTTEINDENSNTLRPLILDTDFRGAYGHLFNLLKEVLRFQYSDFLEGLPVKQAQPTGRKKSKVKAK